MTNQTQQDKFIYLPIYLSDWVSDGRKLTMIQRGALIDLSVLYFQENLQLKYSKEQIYRLVFAFEKQEQEAVDFILENYFIKSENKPTGFYWVSIKLNELGDKIARKLNSSRSNGKKGGRPLGGKKISQKSDWQEMVEFFKNKCLDCGYDFTGTDSNPTKDHIIPKSLGGLDSIDNLQPLCRECNSTKCADHSIDFRIKFISDIPQFLKEKWFIKNNQNKPMGLKTDNLDESILNEIKLNQIKSKETNQIKSNENKELKETEKDFETLWNFYTPVCAKDGTYTNKGSKQKAFISYKKARKKFEHDKIMACLKLYLEDCQKRGGYTMHAVRWLNNAMEDDFEYEQVIPIQSQIKPTFLTKEQKEQEMYDNFLNVKNQF